MAYTIKTARLPKSHSQAVEATDAPIDSSHNLARVDEPVVELSAPGLPRSARRRQCRGDQDPLRARQAPQACATARPYYGRVPERQQCSDACGQRDAIQGSRKFAERGENADANPSPCHNCRCRGPQTGFGNDNAALYAVAASARPKEKSRMVLPRPGRLPLHALAPIKLVERWRASKTSAEPVYGQCVAFGSSCPRDAASRRHATSRSIVDTSNVGVCACRCKQAVVSKGQP